MAGHLSGKLTKRLVESLPAGRHSDGNGLYLVVDPSGARRWVLRVTVKGQKNAKGAPLRTDFGLGGASPAYNRQVGGAKHSMHLQGAAFDICMANHDPESFEMAARAIGFTGFGFYVTRQEAEEAFYANLNNLDKVA